MAEPGNPAQIELGGRRLVSARRLRDPTHRDKAALAGGRHDGRLEISNNAAENQIRPLKVGTKNWIFAGSDTGGVRAAAFYTIMRTAVLNGVEPEAYLTDVIARIGSHPINRLAELLPWNWKPPATHGVAA